MNRESYIYDHSLSSTFLLLFKAATAALADLAGREGKPGFYICTPDECSSFAISLNRRFFY
jgi:hypothetical protein